MERRQKGRLKHQEDVLAAHVAELKADLSACKDARVAAKLACSLGGIKSVEEYARDRERSLQTLLQVECGRDLRVHCDVMREECDMCSKPAHTPLNLPLILHQFYCNRVSQLVQLRHMLMVRWVRIAGSNSKVAEELYHHFQQRMEYVLSEYNDSLHRARRLAASADSHVTKRITPSVTIDRDDVMIYLRWLVTHLHNTKTSAAFISNIGWLPGLYRSEFISAHHPPLTHPHPVTTTPKPAVTASAKWLSAARELHSSTHHTGTESTSHSLTTDRTHHMFSRDDVSRDNMTSHVTTSDITRDHMTMTSSLGGGSVGGTSKAVGVVLSSLPLHTMDVHKLRDGLQELLMRYSIRGSATINSPSDELRLFYESSHKFQSIFPQQETISSLLPYDSLPEKESRGDTCTFTKPANWTEFIQIAPDPDPTQIVAYSKIRDSVTDIDPLLSLSSLTSHLHSPHRAMFALRQHAVTVKQPSLLPPLTTSTCQPSQKDIALVWKCVYMGLDSRNPMNTDELNSMETDVMGTNDPPNMGSPSNYDPTMEVREASQVLHNKKGRGVSAKASSVAKDSYFSSLLLRHLKTRDMRMMCLSILNYFRSVERTLTINHQGLSMESGQQQPTLSGGLLNHRHLHNTPADYIISEVEFMQFTEVENHDDFYEFLLVPEVGRGVVTIWDPQGVKIVYDAALEDLRRLEKEVLTVGTYYIEKGEGLTENTGVSSTDTYSRRDVDRMAILHDLWTAEASYQDNKMKVLCNTVLVHVASHIPGSTHERKKDKGYYLNTQLVNCYLECYHHVSDRTERERMAKVIITLMWSRPHYDPDSAYFTETFDLECRCLEAHRQLVRSIVDIMMEGERGHSDRMWEGRSHCASDTVFGLGLPPSPSHPVSLTGHKPLLPPSSLLETISSLSTLSSLPQSLHSALIELSHHHKVTSSPTHTLTLYLKLLEVCLLEWEEHRTLGTGFSVDTIHNVFWDECVEDAHTVCAVCDECAGEREKGGEGGGVEGADKQATRLQAWCDILELVTLHHHLLLSSSESSLLTRHYKQLLITLEHDECNAHLRCVTFNPSIKNQTEKPLEYFISKVKDSNLSTSLDRYTPAHSSLAVAELDDKHLTTFSFRSHDQIKEILTSRNGLLKLRTALRAEVAHKWCLATASLLNTASLAALEEAGHIKMETMVKPVTGKTVVAPPLTSVGMVTTASEMGRDLFLKKTLQKAFVSVQREKVPVRDHMLAGLSSKVISMGRSQNDMETAKCSAVGRFCGNLVTVMAQYSLRAQVLQLCHSLLCLLEHFPTTRDNYFTIGRISTHQKATPSTIKDTRSHLARPPCLLSPDGSKILNLWYIPHTTEVLTMFSEGPLGDRLNFLKTVLALLSPLLLLLQYHTAYVRLGQSSAGHRGGGGESTGCRGASGIGGDWGGTEGIGTVIHQLQADIASLPDPANPLKVSEYLRTSCEMLYLEHTLTVKHYLHRTFLLHGNYTAVQTLCSASIPMIYWLSTSAPSPHPAYQALPTPTLPPNQSIHTPTLLPWQHFLSKCGPTPSLLDHMAWEVGVVVMAALATLPLSERVTANGEMLGLSLVLEEIGQAHSPSDPSPAPPHLTLPPSHPPSSPTVPTKPRMHTLGSKASKASLTGSSLSHQSSHVASYRDPSSHSPVSPVLKVKVLKEFLVLSLQLEVLRHEWSLQALGGVHSLSTQRQCRQIEQVFGERVLGVARKQVAKQLSHDQAKDGLDESISQSTTFLTEGGVTGGGAYGDGLSSDQLDNLSEMKLREAQVARLLELLELGLIRDTLRHVSQFHHLMMLEQNRDNTILPLDLWKASPSMKEPAGVPRPHIVDRFLSQFHSSSTDSGPAYTISKSALRDSVYQLSTGILHREKECFQIYAGHYEGLVRSLYSQLYQRERQIERWRSKAESSALSSHTEALVTAGEITHTTLLELTALRVRIKELENQLQTQESCLRKTVQLEYAALTHNLLSTCTTIRTRYEDYRSSLYNDVLRSIQEVRQTAARGVAKAKESRSNHSPLDVSTTTKLQGEEVCDIQNENAQLNRLLLKQRAMSCLRQSVCDNVRKREVSVWRGESEDVRKRGLEGRMVMEVEVDSLRGQVNTLQKRLSVVERERDSAWKELTEERETTSKKPQANKAQHQQTQKAPKAVSTKMKELVDELEEKERQISVLEAVQEKQHVEEERGQRRLTHRLQVTRQQLEHERHLKREAFHQVDDLLTQVHDMEDQQHSSLRALQSGQRSIASSTPHSLTSQHHHTSTPHTRHHSVTGSTSHSRPDSHQHRRPKSQQSSRGLSSQQNSETIDLSQEILALKLI